MKIKLSPKVLEKFPGIQYAVFTVKDLVNERRNSALIQLLRGAAAVKKNELRKNDYKEKFQQHLHETIQEDSTLLESHILQSRVKKILNNKELGTEDNLSDALLYTSIKFLVPAFAFDLDNAEKDYLIDFYKPKKGKKAPEPNVSRHTKNAALWFVNLGILDTEQFQNMLMEFQNIVMKYCQGAVSDAVLLNDLQVEMDLEYISQKESEYQEKLKAEEELEQAKIQEKNAESQSEASVEPASELSSTTPNTLTNTEIPVFLKNPSIKESLSLLVADALENTLKDILPLGEQPSTPNNEQLVQPAPIQASQLDSNTPEQSSSAAQEVPIPELSSPSEPLVIAQPTLDTSTQISAPLPDSLEVNQSTLEGLLETPEIEIPKDPTHGDYSTNIALKLAKKLKMNPLELAEKIKEKIISVSYLEAVEIKPPGFINFRLSLNYCIQELQKILQLKDKYGHSDLGKGQKIMIEYGSLNIAKPFGAHHFLTTVIGQTLVNLHRALGYQVLSADYPGDWGTQFGKLMYAYKNWGNKEQIEQAPLDELLKLYIQFHDEAEKNPVLEDEARAEFKKLEEKDPASLELWQWMRDMSMKDLETIYKTLGVHHDRRYPESKYLESCQEILTEGKEKGIFVEGEKGAYIVNLEAEGLPPYLVQKADGATLYATRDLASIKDRNQEKDLKKIIYIVDVAQSLHFKQLFSTAKKLNLTAAELTHVHYGRMRMTDAAMSTRKGNIILGKDIIKEAVSRLLLTVKEKSPDLTPDEQNFIAQGAALGAIKYAMICQNPESDFTFEWERVLSFEGNSAPYLQYTQARANSILKKSKENDSSKSSSEAKTDQVSLFSLEEEQQAQNEETLKPFEDKHEVELLKALLKFPEAVEAAACQYKPNLLTNYLFELAQSFNAFYHALPVLKVKKEDLFQARLNLVQATAQVLKTGLTILGIQTFERM